MISPGFEGYKEIAVATYGYAGEIAKAESLANAFIAKDPRNSTSILQMFRVYRRANMLRGRGGHPDPVDKRTPRRARRVLAARLRLLSRRWGDYAKAADVVQAMAEAVIPTTGPRADVLRNPWRRRHDWRVARITHAQRAIVIGLDGATFDVLGPLMEQGHLPGSQAADGGRRLGQAAHGDPAGHRPGLVDDNHRAGSQQSRHRRPHSAARRTPTILPSSTARRCGRRRSGTWWDDRAAGCWCSTCP